MTIKELIRLDERPGWAPTWSAFHEAAGAPFFTSLAWIQSWVNMLPIGSPAWLFECMNADEVLALGVEGRGRGRPEFSELGPHVGEFLADGRAADEHQARR